MNLNFVLEKDLWKKKYLIEKNQNALIDEQNHSLSVIISNSKFLYVILFIQKNSTDIDNQLEQAKIRLNNSTKV